MKGWELVERRGDGKWYAVSRSYEPAAKIEYDRWVTFQPSGGFRAFALRPVTDQDEPLTASPIPNPRSVPVSQYGNKSLDEIKKEGADFAFALSMVFGKGGNDVSSTILVARQFAKFAGYDTSDENWAYVEGFMQWLNSTKPAAIQGPVNDQTGS